MHMCHLLLECKFLEYQVTENETDVRGRSAASEVGCLEKNALLLLLLEKIFTLDTSLRNWGLEENKCSNNSPRTMSL